MGDKEGEISEGEGKDGGLEKERGRSVVRVVRPTAEASEVSVLSSIVSVNREEDKDKGEGDGGGGVT